MDNLSIILKYINNNRKNVIIIGLVVIIFIMSCFLIYEIYKEPKIKIVEKKIVKKIKIKEKKKILVDIKGQVKHPGVYEMNKNDRINDVIKKAGGLTDSANVDYINLSKKIEDEMVIFIYSDYEISKMKDEEKIEESKPILEDENLIKSNNVFNKKNDEKTSDNTTSEGVKVNGKVNINTASLEELMTLTGVGESKAKAIIEYREKNKFKSIEEIKEVRGIGDSIFDKIKENITI